MNNTVKANHSAIRAADRRRNTRHVGPNVRTLTVYIVLPDDAKALGPEWLEQFVIAQIQEATRNAAAEIVSEVFHKKAQGEPQTQKQERICGYD